MCVCVGGGVDVRKDSSVALLLSLSFVFIFIVFVVVVLFSFDLHAISSRLSIYYGHRCAITQFSWANSISFILSVVVFTLSPPPPTLFASPFS